VVGECEVADVEELIAWPDARVVALDHDLVHLFNGGERPLGELDDPLVAVVGVGRMKTRCSWPVVSLRQGHGSKTPVHTVRLPVTVRTCW